MRRCAIVSLLTVLLPSLASAFYALVPDGKELVYSYKAHVKAGTISPSPYASEFFLQGKLHLQSANTSVFVQLSDVKYKLYNGDSYYNHEHKLSEIPVPQEAEDILKAFKIVYENNGQVKGIVTEKEEKTYARNMHKAIANILQLNLEKINLDENKIHAFGTEEQSIHGKIFVAYNVLPKGKNKLEVHKMREMKTTKPIYSNMVSNAEPERCEAHYEDPIFQDSRQYYFIKKLEEHYFVKFLEATGGTYIAPFLAKSQFQFVHANVTLRLLDNISFKKKLRVDSEHYEENLTYDIVDPSIETVLPDITNGRRVLDMESQIPVVESMLEDLVEWSDQNHLENEQPDFKREQLVNRLVRLLNVLDQSTLEQIYNTLNGRNSDKSRIHLDIMHELLPLVGSHASVMLVKKIIHEKKVNDYVAVSMLYFVASLLREPSKKILQDTEDMLTWDDDLNLNVRKAAILCFASLIRKTFQHEKTIQDSITDHEIYSKYVNYFINAIKSTEDYAIQMLYLQALSNAKLPSVVEHLKPIIRGEQASHRKVRLMAMRTVASIVSDNFEKVFELYWPIFSDWNEYPELRILAYYIIMESRPPISRLLNIHWEMQTQPNTELYHFHYTYLLAMARTIDPCHQVFTLNVAQILKITRKPNQQALSGYYLTDYLNKQYKFGEEMNALIIATDSTRIFQFVVNYQMFNVRTNHYSVYIRIDGLKNAIDREITFSLNSVWKVLRSVQAMKDVTVEVSIGHDHQTSQIYYFNSSNVLNATTLVKFFHTDQSLIRVNGFNMHYSVFTQILWPTETGVPVLMQIINPTIYYERFNIGKDILNNVINVTSDSRIHIHRPSSYGLSFYNPIGDVWQGVNRYHSYNLVLYFYADIIIDTEQHILKMSVKKHQDQNKNIAGLRNYITNMVFVEDKLHHDTLVNSCSVCHPYTIVTKGDHDHNNYTVYHEEGYNSGYDYHAIIDDRELLSHHTSFLDFLNNVASKHTVNYENPIQYLLLFFRSWLRLDILQPSSSSRSFLFKAVPSSKNPVTQTDLTLHFDGECNRQDDKYLPGMKINTYFTYALKNEEETIKSWGLNATVDVAEGHSLRNIKINFTRIVPGQTDSKVCMESTKKWNMNGVNEHMNILMGQSADGKCNKDGASIDITMVGEQLPEQKTPYHTYEICEPYSHYLGPDYHSARCLAAHTSVRKYIYDIKTANVATEFKKYFFGVFDHLREWYKPYYHYDDEHDEHLAEDNVKVVIEYPMAGHEMDVDVITPHHAYEFTGIPTNSLAYWGFYPDNTHYSKLYMMTHYMGMMRTCTVDQQHVYHGLNEHKHTEAFQLPTEWTLFVGDAEKDCQHGVYLKKVEDTKLIALRTVHGSYSLELHPEGKHGKDWKVIVNGKELSQTADYHAEDWFSIMIRPRLHRVILSTFHFHLHMEYSDDKVIIKIPNAGGVHFYGHCMHA